MRNSDLWRPGDRSLKHQQKHSSSASGSKAGLWHHSRALKASHVLAACGVPPEKIHGSLLFSFGKENDEADVDYVIEVLPPIVARLRAMSPFTGEAG